MFQWYQKATQCYAYLADVSVMQDSMGGPASSWPWEEAFRKSRWFSRGWTLQELIAPSSVQFYSVQGIRLGDKVRLEDVLHEVTRIPREALRGADLTQFTIDERFSWAQNRQTTRKEDKAYSLLGIFGIFVPLMYGEGDHALIRLREEIELSHAKSYQRVSQLPTARQAAFNSHDNQHGATCLPGTRKELLQGIAEWADGANKPAIFWLNGLAGTGKSTIARTVARTHYDRGDLGASFFFSKKGGDVGRADTLITTIASQMVARIPALGRHISAAVIENPEIATHSLRDQWDQLIIKPVSKIDRPSGPPLVVIVIDALDECESEMDIRIILRLLATNSVLSNIRLRIFITSRPELSVRSGFSQIAEVERQSFVLHNIAPTTVDQDLGRFFEHSFTLMREERGLSADWPGVRIIRQLVVISCGLFIWASTACRFIHEGRRFAMRRISLLINNPGIGTDPEKQLDDIYLTVLRDSVQEGYWEEEKQSLHEILRQVVGSIAILFTPLSRVALAKLLDLSSSDIDETLADLHTVFNLPIQHDLPIRLHHPTFRDFIVNQERCRDPDFWVNEQKAHKSMAGHCIVLMSRMLKRDICGLGSPGTTTDSIDREVVKSRIPPELEYACRYWVQHYRKSGSRLHDGDQAHQFLQQFFLHWLEAMTIMGKSAEIAAALRMYYSLIVPEQSLRLVPFAYDARRFYFAVQPTIEHTPLQIYCSALAFSPRHNEIRHHFWTQMHEQLHDVQIAEPVERKGSARRIKATFFVNHISFTPDGQQILSGSTGPELRLWDVKTKAAQGNFERQTKNANPYTLRMDGLRTDGMRALAISNDHTTVASGSDDALVTVWDWRTRTVKYDLRGHSSWVNCVAFSIDGTLLASGSMDETIQIWSMEAGQKLHTLKGDLSCVNDVAFCPNGSLLVSGSADKIVRVWNAAQGGLLMLLDGHAGVVNSVRFSADGKRIVSGSDDTTIKIWDAITGSEYKTLKGHQRKVLAVTFSPDAALVASGSEDMEVKLWHVITGAILNTFSGHASGVNAVAFSPSNLLLASSSYDVNMRLWDAKTGEACGLFDEHSAHHLVQTMEGLKISDDHSLQHSTLEGHSGVVICAASSPTGQHVVTGSYDSTMKLWTVAGPVCRPLEGHAASVNFVIFSPNTHLLVSASSDTTAKLWDAATGALWHTLRGHSNSVRLARFSPDGQYIATCSSDKTARIWHTGTGVLCAKFEGHLDTVNDIAFAPGKELVASCSADGTVKLWQMHTGILQDVFRGHSDTVNSVACSSDGRFIVSCSADKTIRLWKTFGGPCMQFKGHKLPVNSAALSPDNKLVVSCADDETIMLWDVTSESVKAVLPCETVVRAVCFSDCGRYIKTDRGVLSLNLSRPFPLEFEMFASNNWVRIKGKDVIWLPKEYEATSVASTSRAMVLGHRTGGISFIYIP
ncbi:hypothetical protein LTR10_004759 [Elasticomyces elasticus]|nr:hypothetical protein LTR10_004759 [Elasticomyces elasticus]KAK4977076.1 hypothetical protein LTR42_003122 [Elasticomyces elasticus]